MSEDPRWTLRQGDVVTALHHVPTAWADAVVTTPRAAGDRPPFYGAWLTMVLGQCRMITRDGGHLLLLAKVRDVALHVEALRSSGWALNSIVPWHRPGPLGAWPGSDEYVVWAAKGTPGQDSAPVRGPDRSRAGRLRDLIRCCPRGGKVLDPFAGSGAVALAALAEGRSFLGLESCDRRYHAARRRLTLVGPAVEDTAVGFPVPGGVAVGSWPPVRL